MQNPFTGVKKKSNKSLVQKKPGALTADAVNKPAIKSDCYSCQVMNNGKTFIKYYLQLDALFSTTVSCFSIPIRRRNWTRTGQYSVKSLV